ncbi:MAG: DUF1330 domain-containing protein [Chloroflexi bacterium]|nr:DUF1330 domain-containing protein [Chloroflexota bacterium]OJW04330.1 MAG: hypothetical protein BGO39_11235 [Chloroflexi bacterium 54-19]
MKGYVLVLVNIDNPEVYREVYSAFVLDTLAPYGGRFLVRGGPHQLLEGDLMPDRVVVIEFDSYEKALAWYNSDTYQALRLKRVPLSKANFFVVQGV